MRQYDLARAAGVSTSYISELENGARNGTIDVWKKVAGVLGTGLDELLASEAKLSGMDRPLLALTKVLPLYDRALESPPQESRARPSGEFRAMAHLWGPDRYALRCQDQTMHPTLQEGDLVLVEARDKITLRQASGRICVVLHNGEAVLRRVELSRNSPGLPPSAVAEPLLRKTGRPPKPGLRPAKAGGRKITLRADNPLVPPVEVKPKDEFKVCGICVRLVEREL